MKKRPLPPDRRKKGGSFARAAGSYVPKIAAKAFERFGFHTAEIFMQWPRIAGAEFAAWTAPERIRWPKGPAGDSEDARPGGTLVVRVDPARALDVEYRAAEIIDRINRYFGYRAVETLKLVQAPLSVAPLVSRPENRGKPSPGAPAAAPPPCVTHMPEGGLKAALAELWASLKRPGQDG